MLPMPPPTGDAPEGMEMAKTILLLDYYQRWSPRGRPWIEDVLEDTF